MTNNKEPEMIFVNGIVSVATLMPQVMIEIGEIKTQVSADKATQVALLILDAAASATTDAFLVKFIMDKTGCPADHAVGLMLGEFRAFRDKLREQQFKEDKEDLGDKE